MQKILCSCTWTPWNKTENTKQQQKSRSKAQEKPETDLILCYPGFVNGEGE